MRGVCACELHGNTHFLQGRLSRMVFACIVSPDYHHSSYSERLVDGNDTPEYEGLYFGL